MAGARAVLDVELRPAQLLPVAITPDPHGVVGGAIAVVFLLGQQDDGVVIEPQLAVHPPESLGARLRGPAGRLRLPHRAQAPGPVTRPDPAGGLDGDLVAADAQDAGPGPQLREARRVQEKPPPVPGDVLGLLNGRERAVPGKVEADAVLIAVAGQPDPA